MVDGPPPQRKEFHWNAPSYFGACNSLFTQKCFQNSQYFRNWEPSEIYISLWCLYKFETIEVYISVHIDLLFYLFLCGNASNRLQVRWYRMADKSPHIWCKVKLTFQSDWYPPKDLIWGHSDMSIKCLSISSFYKVFHNDKNAQCGINHIYTVVSQKCNICKLNSYST